MLVAPYGKEKESEREESSEQTKNRANIVNDVGTAHLVVNQGHTTLVNAKEKELMA